MTGIMSQGRSDRRLGTGFGTAGLVFLADQFSKWAVLAWLGSPVYSVTSFFNIILVWNRGISFGLLSSGNSFCKWALCGLAVSFIVMISIWICKAQGWLACISYGLILGGATGNLIDRLRFDAVVDFMDFHALGYHWYVFNIADCAIVTGVILLVFQQWQETRLTGKFSITGVNNEPD